MAAGIQQNGDLIAYGPVEVVTERLWELFIEQLKSVTERFSIAQEFPAYAFELSLQQQTSGLSKLNFRVSRFGDSHGCPVKTVAIAKTAQSSNPAF